ncbi:metallophosphoesterase [Mesobacterium pallidum]|uniref:metallophosphoesterase n=1 Tax=Mesobacterium pallidum TaxID=2872037 RepID=UPI001EE1B90F|nr:metallophosphoesterase [Mesobacterium pallidum]
MIYVLGDIHGFSGELDWALEKIEADGGPDARIVFLGDLVDRGPDARGVIQRLIDGIAAGRDWTVLKGNHDRMMQWFLTREIVHDRNIRSGISWLHDNVGGRTTLGSYGVEGLDRPLSELRRDALEAVPQSHVDFLGSLRLSHDTEDVFFCHAGVRPGVPLTAQVEDDLLWIRTPFLEHDAPFEKLVVHGHTALEAPMRYPNRINMDGGTGYGRKLWPLVLEGTRGWLLTRHGRVEI